METNNILKAAFVVAVGICVGFLVMLGLRASAATSFSTASPFKQGGTSNTQIIPAFPTYSFNIPVLPPQSFAAASSTTGGSLGSGMPLYFMVAALNPTGTTTPSSEIATTTQAALSQVNLTWTPSPGATGYAIYYSTTTPGAENAYQIATTTNAYDFTSTSSPAYATPLGFPTAFAVQLSNTASALIVNGVSATQRALTTASIGGSALTAGQCSTGTTTVPVGTTVSSTTAFMTTPQKYPGSGIIYQSYALNSTQVVTQICGLLSVTPVSTVYNVKAF